MQYRPELILQVNFGEYDRERGSPPSVDLIPLLDFKGFGYVCKFLANPQKLKNLSEYDRSQIRHIIRAYDDFGVKIKCMGKDGECKEIAREIDLPYEYVHRHENQGGPLLRKQIDVQENRFYCPSCSQEFAFYSEEPVMKFPISFSILERGGFDVNIDRTHLHGMLKKIAYQLIFQTADDMINISTMREPDRMVINNQQAKQIANRLLRAQHEVPLFDNEYKERPLFRLTPQRREQSS